MQLTRGRKIFLTSLSFWLVAATVTTLVLLGSEPIRFQLSPAAIFNDSDVEFVIGQTEITQGDIMKVVGIFGSFAGMAMVTAFVFAKSQ